jgi:hypothetical protein
MVQHLLGSLAQQASEGAGVSRVVLTLNLPEPEPLAPAGGWPFVLQVRHNSEPQGFSANHNAALADASEPLLCVINPDVDLSGGNPFPALLRAVQRQGVGLAYPMQVDEHGQLQDSERELPTPWSLLRRYAVKRRETRAEWVNGAMWLLPTPVWQGIGGLNTSYFMYCEDVELCLRLRLAGWTLARADAVVGHAGQRASHRRAGHALWHIRSLLRLWTSAVFWRARALLRRTSTAALTMTE